MTHSKVSELNRREFKEHASESGVLTSSVVARSSLSAARCESACRCALRTTRAASPRSRCSCRDRHPVCTAARAYLSALQTHCVLAQARRRARRTDGRAHDMFCFLSISSGTRAACHRRERWHAQMSAAKACRADAPFPFVQEVSTHSSTPP
jgi:hypothetical protein